MELNELSDKNFFLDEMKALPTVFSEGASRKSDCIPHVSMYTDCTAENKCSGCTKCLCSGEGKWLCNKVYECQQQDIKIDRLSINNALNTLLSELKMKQESSVKTDDYSKDSLAKLQQDNKKADQLLGNEFDDADIVRMISRQKRAVKNKKGTKDGRRKSNGTEINDNNGTVKFFNTVDEINEDTLKNSNLSGVIQAAKVDMSHLLSRQSDYTTKTNASTNPLHIEYSNPHQNIDNKLEGNGTVMEIAEQEKLGIIANHTQQEKDSDLSKIIVNELKKGQELIGDQHGPIMSNITFTPENDTLTAMAFIAGNLLNKLWSMEKDSGDESMEVETLKNEKLQDLLDLFKEPLTMRQEAFLRNALETLSRAMDKRKDANITFCETIADAKKFLEDSKNRTWEKSDIKLPESVNRKNNINDKEIQTNATIKAIEKLNSVLGLMKKYETISKHLNVIKKAPNKAPKGKNNIRMNSIPNEETAEGVSVDESNSLNLFGNILQKVTKLLLPYKASKKMASKISKLNVFADKESDIKGKFKEMFNVDLPNSTLSVKDKTVMDYLTKIKNRPSSLLDEVTSDEVPTSFIEGDILLNLSEFFKIKSFVELMKLVEDKKETPLQRRVTLAKELLETTTEIAIKKLQENIETDIEIPEFRVTTETSTTQKPKFAAKDKLKAHLRTILDDLVELQKEKGIPDKKGDIKIADVLPCIYNMLNYNKELKTTLDTKPVYQKPVSSYTTLSGLFDEIKKELSSSVGFRRRMNNNENIYPTNPPISTTIWERVISNVGEERKMLTRRNFETKMPLSYEEIQKKINNLTDYGTPKTDSFAAEAIDLPPSERLLALQSILVEVKRHLEILKDIKTSYVTIEGLPEEKKNNISQFVLNANNVIDIDRKYLENLESTTVLKNTMAEILDPNMKIYTKPLETVKQKEAMRAEPENYDKNMKLTRDEILNQLIKNRVTLYMKTKQGKEGAADEQNYNIAKTILNNLESGNVALARTLYKIFVNNKQQQNSVNIDGDKKFADMIKADRSERTAVAAEKVPFFFDKQPLIQFEEPKSYTNQLLTARRDQMLRNLLNSKNFKII